MRHALRANWVIPALYAIVAIAATLLLPRAEHALLPDLQSPLTPSQATAIFAAVGTGMIALTSVVFSITFVMVQFSASAYSPRLVLWVARDPVIWHALGMFSATFFYSLGAIAWVDRGGQGRTPLLSGMLVLAMLFASMGMFIALMDRVAMLQIGRMLGFTADYGRRVIEETYPLLDGEPPAADSTAHLTAEGGEELRFSGRPRIVQSLDVPRLLSVAARCGGTVVISAPVGDTLVEGTVLARVHGARRGVDIARLRQAFRLGDERTFEQDAKYAIRLLVDIAIKALSPAINDPSTAVQALDEIEDLLIRLGRRRLELGTYLDATGVVRVVVPFPSWDDFLALALDEIRQYGASSVQVMRRMNALVVDLLSALPEERSPALHEWQRRLDASIARSFEATEERQEAAVADRQGLGAPRPEPETT